MRHKYVFPLLLLLLSLGTPWLVRANVNPAPQTESHLFYHKSMNSGESGTGWKITTCGSDFDNAPYYTVPGMKQTFTVDRDSKVELNFVGLGRNSKDYGAIYVAFFVDGQVIKNAFGHTQLGGRRQGTAEGKWIWHSLANMATATVSPGTHTVEVKAKCDLSGEGRVWNGWFNVGVYSNEVTPPPIHGDLTGRVKDADNGKAISRAWVTLGWRFRITDANGNYSFSNVPVGNHTLRVTKSDYESYQATITIEGGYNTQNVNLNSNLNGLTLPIDEKIYFTKDGDTDYVNAYADLDTRSAYVYDYRHPNGSKVKIRGKWRTAPWSANLWRLGIAYNGHDGTDYRGHLNSTKVIAAAPGYILSYRDKDPDYNRSLTGNYVYVKHTDIKGRTVYILYHHLERGTIPAAIKRAAGTNKLIPRGAVLGRVGMSGNTTGPHLHFEVRRCRACYTGYDPYTADLWQTGTTRMAQNGNPISALSVVTYSNQLPTAIFTVTPSVSQLDQVITFDANNSDDVDGSIVQYIWDLGDGNWRQGKTITHTYTKEGNYFASLTTVDDQSGATLSDPLSIIVSEYAGSDTLDVTPPDGEITIMGNGFTADSAITLGLSLMKDENPTKTLMRFSADGEIYGEWEPFAEQKRWSIGSQEGYHYIYAQFKDETGNLSLPVVDMVLRDTTPPTLTLGPPITNTPGTTTFSWNVGDAGTLGNETLMSTTYQLMGVDTTWQTAEWENLATYTDLPEGTYTFQVRGIDWAGNQSEAAMTVKIKFNYHQIYLPLLTRH